MVVAANDLAAPNKKNTIHILHVDDDPSLQEITKLMLLDLDNCFEIDQACCVDEAFKKLSTGHYDVVVSDYEMPLKNGLQFLQELREQKNYIPFVLFTGKGREEVTIIALNSGADAYHNKQGSPETVYGELAHSIKLNVERYRAKETLKERDTRFMKLAAQTPGMLFQFLRRPDGTFCVPFTSEGISEIFGCSPQDVQNDFSPIVKAIIPEDLEKVIQSIEHSATTLSVWQSEYRVHLPGQKTRWMWGQSAPEKLEDGSILWSGYNTDITERKNAEEKLRGTIEVLDRIGDSVDAGLAVIGKDYRVVWANRQLMGLGVTPNKRCHQVFNRSETMCPDCGVIKIFEENVPLDVHEYKTVNAQGNTIWLELRVTPLKDKDGNVTAALELAVPITERKKAEEHRKSLERKLEEYSKHLKYMVDLRTIQLKDANERLVKSERLAAIGELAGMVGHDLRNPLATIKNASYFLKKKDTAIPETQYREILETIDKSIDHSDKIINDLLDYSREMRLELTKYSADTLVNEAMEITQVPDRIKIVNHVDEDILVWVDVDKMMRVFINLIKNAIEAMPEKGTLKISSCQTEECVAISFADSGTGIPKETLKNLFTPLFTTKAQGMGFGLSICKRIIEAHEGNITVETAVNKGTTFTITVPLKPNAKVECEKTCINKLGE